MLVPQPGIERRAPVLEMQSPNHWTAGEVPLQVILKFTVETWISKHPSSGSFWVLFSLGLSLPLPRAAPMISLQSRDRV